MLAPSLVMPFSTHFSLGAGEFKIRQHLLQRRPLSKNMGGFSVDDGPGGFLGETEAKLAAIGLEKEGRAVLQTECLCLPPFLC